MRRSTPVNQAKLDTLVCDDRADGRCECEGQCGYHTERCTARRGHMLPDREHTWVRLRAVPRDGTPNMALDNLVAACQRCVSGFKRKPQAPVEQEAGLFDLPETGGKGTPTL